MNTVEFDVITGTYETYEHDMGLLYPRALDRIKIAPQLNETFDIDAINDDAPHPL